MALPDLSAPRKRTGAVFPLVFALLLLRYCALGMTYYPQLDDYIQYHSYLTSESFSDLARSVGLLASRPLAGVTDYYLWGRMFDVMILGVALISLMYTAYVLCAARLLGRYFRVGPIFLAVACFLPLGMEGLYWMSASTRIVVGLFFGVLAALAFAGWLDTGRWYFAALYLPLQLLPFGFYEQSAILSTTFVLGLALLECRKRKGRVLLGAWALVSMVLYFAFLKYMAGSGVYGSRTELVPPNTMYYWKVFFPEITRQVGSVFLKGGFLTLVKGFVRGLPVALARPLWLIALMLCCAALVLVLRRERPDRPDGAAPLGPLWAILAGALLALAPVSLFFLLANPWFTVRGAAPSLLGLGLMADALSRLIFSCFPGGWRRPCAVLAGVMILVFSVASLSELKDYRDTWYNDQKAARVILDGLKGAPPETRVGILGLEATFLPDQNYYYHGHISGCTESDWALSGLLTAMGGESHPAVTPLPSSPMYWAWNAESRRPEIFDRLYWYNGEVLLPVWLEPDGWNGYRVYTGDRSFVGRIWEEEGPAGYFAPEG